MKSFTDRAGRRWTIAVTVAAVKRVRAELGLDLYGLVGDGFAGLAALLGDVVKFVDVLWLLTRGVPGNPAVADEEFGGALAGDELGAATDAFLAELTEFFPDPKVRAGLAAVIAKGRAVESLMIDGLMERIAAVDPATVARTLSGSSGGSPAPSASTPGP